MLARLKKILAVPLAAGSKFDVGHAVAFLAFFATVGGPMFYTFLTSEDLPVYAGYVTKAIATAAFLVALYRQWSAQSNAAVDDAKKASLPADVTAKNTAQAGFIRLPTLYWLTGVSMLVGLVLALAVLVQGCTPTQIQTAQATIPADVQLGLCVASVAESDAGKPVGQVLLDELAKCTADIAPIVAVLSQREVEKVVAGKSTVDQANAAIAAIYAAAKLGPPKLLVMPVVIGKHAMNLPMIPPVWTFEPASDAPRSLYGVVLP